MLLLLPFCQLLHFCFSKYLDYCMPSLRNSRAYEQVLMWKQRCCWFHFLYDFQEPHRWTNPILFSLCVWTSHFWFAYIFPHVRQFLPYPTTLVWAGVGEVGGTVQRTHTLLHAWHAVLWPVIQVYFWPWMSLGPGIRQLDMHKCVWVLMYSNKVASREQRQEMGL